MSTNFDEREADKVLLKTLKLYESLDTKELEQVSDRNGVNIWQKEFQSEPLLVLGKFKSKTMTPILLEKFWRLSVEDGYDLNPYLLEKRVLQEFSKEKTIVTERYTAGTLMVMVSIRDFVYANHFYEKNGEYFLIRTSLENVPSPRGGVRAKIRNLVHMNPIKDGGYEVTSMLQLDFGGWLPQWLVDKAIFESPYFLIKMNMFVEQQVKIKYK